jgi:hypothetical protein
MAVIIPTNYQVSAPFPIDTRMGVFTSVSNANSSIPSIYRYQGLTVIIASGGVAYDYWYKDGITNGNLVLKTLGSTISAGNLMSTTSDVISFIGGTVSGGSLNVDVSASNEFRFRGNDAVTPTLTLAGNTTNAWSYLRLSPNGTASSYIDSVANSLFFSNNGTIKTKFDSSGNWSFYSNVAVGSSATPTSKLDIYATGTSVGLKQWNGTNTVLTLKGNGTSENYFDIPNSYANTNGEVLKQTTISLAGGSNTFVLNQTSLTGSSEFSGTSTSPYYLNYFLIPKNTSSTSYFSPIYATAGAQPFFEVNAQNSPDGGDQYGTQTFLKLTSIGSGSSGGNRPQIFLNNGTSTSFLSFIQPTLGATVQSSYALTLEAFASISSVGVGTTSYGSLGIGSATRGVSIQPTATAGNVSSWNLNWTGINSGLNHRMVSRNNVTSSGVQNLLFVPSVGGTATQPTTTSANRILHLLGDTATSRYFVGMGLVASGEQPTALATVGASTTSYASFRMYAGVDPTSPNAGDMWYSSVDNNYKLYTQSQIRNIVNTFNQNLANNNSIWGANVSGNNARVTSSSEFTINASGTPAKFLFNEFNAGTYPLNQQNVGVGKGLVVGNNYTSGAVTAYPAIWITPAIDPVVTVTNGGELYVDANERNFRGYIKNGDGDLTDMAFLTYFTPSTVFNFDSGSPVTAYGGANTVSNKTTYLVNPDGWIEFNLAGVRKIIPIYDPYVAP